MLSDRDRVPRPEKPNRAIYLEIGEVDLSIGSAPRAKPLKHYSRPQERWRRSTYQHPQQRSHRMSSALSPTFSPIQTICIVSLPILRIHTTPRIVRGAELATLFGHQSGDDQ
jgi:hypothetical protein